MTSPDLSAEEMLRILDTYMPTIITGVNHMAMKSREKPEEKWDEDDVATLAAYSYAHNMLHRLSGRQNVKNDSDYDLPSVIDLMVNLRARSVAIDLTLEQFPETYLILGKYQGRLFGGHLD